MTATTTQPLETGWLPDIPVEDTLLRRFIHNQAAHNEVLAGPGGRAHRTDGVFLADSGSPVSFLNQAILARPLTGIDDGILDCVDSFFGRRRFPGRRARGDRRIPLDEALRRPVGSVLPASLAGTDLEVRVGVLDGDPVAVGNVFISHGLVNLSLGATLPAARRRGIWEALVGARVAAAPDLPAIAYTSDFSRPGFLRMGFLPLTRFTLWAKGPQHPAEGARPDR
jgi:hypothetical protein